MLFTFHGAFDDVHHNMAAMSIFERENRRQRIEKIFGAEAPIDTESEARQKVPGKASAGIFNKKQVSFIYDSFLHVRRPPLQFLISNDTTPLAYRVYNPVDAVPVAVVICVTQNNIFQDVLASKLSRAMLLKVYLCEVRGFGYSGGTLLLFKY